MAKRRLIVFFDGTWNTPDKGSEITNVVKLLRAIPARDGDISQICYYDRGVGTGDFTDRIIGGASGKGLTENVIDGYRFLGNNYAPGDEIYIFGFSRGAYTARSLAGFIGITGMHKPSSLGWPLEEVIKVCHCDMDRDAKRAAIDDLKADAFADVQIRCVGVWDTVGSLGIPGDFGRKFYLKPYLFPDVELGEIVDVALHGVAIDEKRSAFSPTLWVSADGKPTREGQIVEQVWLPGVHSNIGGSYADSGLSDIALDWMVKRIEKHTDLVVDKDYLAGICAPNSAGIGYESRSNTYFSSRMYPYQRLINQTAPDGKGFGEWFRQKFEDADRRNLVPEGLMTINEMLHVSALERWKLDSVLHDAKHDKDKPVAYRPSNLQAVITQRNVPVVDSNGDLILPELVPWPA